MTKPGRYFFTSAAVIVLVMTVIGFHRYYTSGEGEGGRKISPDLFHLVLVHGTLMTAWMVLFLVQALLISSNRRRLHMKLGWLGVAVAAGVTVSGSMLAVQSVRAIPTIPFFGMAYRQFLLVMLVEIAVFASFVLAGVLFRKRPEKHRPMMLLASLSILGGATVRMPFLFPIYGAAGCIGIFGPIFTLGAILLVARSARLGTLDKPFAAGYAVMVVAYAAACQLAFSDAWTRLSGPLLNS